MSDRKTSSLWSLASLRYGGSGWWLDAALPRSPIGLLAISFAFPIAWVFVGYIIATDRAAYLATHDIIGQLWFFPLHVVCVRLLGRQWATRLDRSCDGLGLDARAKRRIARGALGTGASIGALLACAYFIVRDVSFGLTPSPSSGLIPFDDPEMWDFAALGRGVHGMMLGLWILEWLLFGYLLWVQIWILVRWIRELRRTDLRPHLATILLGDGYRPAFALFSDTTTISLVFALGNLGFIAYTGELLPREVVEIAGVGDFLREMSDLLSTTLLFVLALVAAGVFVRTLRKRLTRAVDSEYTAMGDRALERLGEPLVATGDPALDIEQLRGHANAQADLIRAFMFQREVDTIGGKTMLSMVAKALVPLATTALKMRKLVGL
jgi:hypothetical protein